jgi:4-amino-4-deoxy-L-arabinose transferase-like glycosyltransferase
MELCDDGHGRVVRPRALSPRAQLALIAIVLTAVRLIFAGAIHLTEDEAYYQLWAQHLQAGYFDHPPMIAWWIRLGTLVAGDTALGVRLLPTLATGATTWLLGDTALRLGLEERTAARAALWWNATFTIGLGGLLATPDTPACFFWALSVWCLARAWRAGAAAAWWIGAGVAAGLCCLSKYSGLFLAPGVLLWLLLTPNGPAALRRPWPWLAAAAAIAIFLPNVVWNASHGWITFDKQFGRVAGHGLRIGHLPEFLLAQFLLLNPLLAALAARGAAEAWRRRADPDQAGALLPLATVAPFWLYLLAHSLHDRVQGHWPAPAYGALAIAAALAAETSSGWIRRVTPVAGLGLSAIVLVHLALPRSANLGALDPARPLRGWNGFAQDVETLRQREGAGWVGVESYGVLSQLAGERRLRAPLVQIIERDRWFDWDRAADFTHPGLVLDLERRVRPADLRRCFAVVAPAGTLERGRNLGRGARYAAYRVQGPRYDLLRQGCPWGA